MIPLESNQLFQQYIKPKQLLPKSLLKTCCDVQRVIPAIIYLGCILFVLVEITDLLVTRG
jgi:hypothetical protein